MIEDESMRLSAFIEGLRTLQPYYVGGDGYHIGAEHDQFYAYPTDRPLSPEDVQKMRDLDWFQPDVEENSPYDPKEGWSAFT
jgi:hypothetical protein